MPVFSVIYLGPSILAAKTGGLPAVFGLTVFADLVEVLLSRSLRHLRALFPPAISGLIVAVVGLDLGLVGVDHLLGVDVYHAPDFARQVSVAALTLGIAVGSSVWSKGLMRLMCSAVAIAFGSTIAFLMGLVSSTSIERVLAAPLFALPDPRVGGYAFPPGLMPAFFISGLAAALRTVGVITTCQKINDRDWKRPDLRSIEGGMLADGLGCVAGGLLGTMGMNTGPSLVGVAEASGATSQYVAFACGATLVLFSFLPKITAVFLSLPLAVVGSGLVFTASFMIAGGIQIMVSRNIDTRMTYVIGISLLVGLSKDVYRGYFAALPAVLQPVASSMLALTLIVALTLNLVFRIGVRRRESFVFDNQDLTTDKFGAFLTARGKTWNVSTDVIERATSSAEQVLEHLAAAHLVQGATRAVVSYDERQLLVEISYEGTLLTLPNVGVKRGIFLEEESFSYGLADFLTGVYPDRMEYSARGTHVTIRLHFTAQADGVGSGRGRIAPGRVGIGREADNELTADPAELDGRVPTLPWADDDFVHPAVSGRGRLTSENGLYRTSSEEPVGTGVAPGAV